LYISVNPISIPVGGTSTVKVVGYKASGTFLPDETIISFSCDIGSIESQAQIEDGIAYATFRSDDNRAGIAHITAHSGNAQVFPESLNITIGGSLLKNLFLSADPLVLPVEGGSSKIKVIAYDEYLNIVPNIPVTFTTNTGQLDSGGDVIYTNAGGAVEDTLHTTSTAIVTAVSGDISASITITVESNENPIASFIFSPTSPIINQKIYFNASESSDPDGYIVNYKWNFGDGSANNGKNVTHQYTYPGTFVVFLEVIDNNGNTGSTNRNVLVGNNQNPTASFVYSPSSPKIGETIYFNAANSSDPDGTITSYQWNFGDGNMGNGESVNHSYANAGTFTVVLVIYDDRGGKATTSQSIKVSI